MSGIVDALGEVYWNGNILQKENEVLKRKNETLRTENVSLKERLTHYEKPQLDSHNSRIPSSLVKSAVSYGVNIHVLVDYLSTAQHIPFKRLVEVLNEFSGLNMILGSVSNILNRMRKQGLARYNEIKQDIPIHNLQTDSWPYRGKKVYGLIEV